MHPRYKEKWLERKKKLSLKLKKAEEQGNEDRVEYLERLIRVADRKLIS
ncbi:hypothetical protein [Orenia marismortui]|uniref:Uncharacterized protein n=1 Tax=Orenia marismortui TaxID=46469 RepID=A0A4R8HA38_9FIRM|nr:hypothetical protein [Orenia marismortui]TDX52168.1 hypothetical protein C7959_10890 [Orenia marismortui]